MKTTKIIAGLGVVAGLAVAAAPLAAFADTNVGVDTLTITVQTGCDMEATSGTTYQAFEHTYTGTLTPGSLISVGGSSASPATSVTVVCNAAGGYSIKAVGTPLAIASGSENIPLVDPVAGTSGWGGKYAVSGSNNSGLLLVSGYGTTAKALPSTAAAIATNDDVSADGGDTFSVIGYDISADTEQKAGAYTGSATYTLAFTAN